MKDKNKYSTSQLFNFAQGSYLERTSRPVYALVFLLPFIVFYELGTIFLNTNVLFRYWQGRVVAFSWIQQFLAYLGLGGKLTWLATPLAVVLILIGLQLSSRKGWGFSLKDIVAMLPECILLAVPLIVLGLFLTSPFRPQSDAARIEYNSRQIKTQEQPGYTSFEKPARPAEDSADAVGPEIKLLADIVTAVGAGIYEELAFRLILICLLMLFFQDVLRFSHSTSIILSVLVSAGLFSAYHHIDFFSGQVYQTIPFSWAEFGFRTAAGVYFAIVFAIRGFGITAGTHAFYDVIATVINAFFFTD